MGVERGCLRELHCKLCRVIYRGVLCLVASLILSIMTSRAFVFLKIHMETVIRHNGVYVFV